MFRLADAYLIYAEAVLRGGGGSTAQALTYVNALRQRAYGDTSGNITAAQLTLDFILDERGRELLWEAHRRTDLVRYGRFTGGEYLWAWKGGAAGGTATESFRDLYPLPANELMANPNLDAEPGVLSPAAVRLTFTAAPQQPGGAAVPYPPPAPEPDVPPPSRRRSRGCAHRAGPGVSGSGKAFAASTA